MRLLLISAYYHPFFHPRAHRWTTLAEHWAAQGWDVHVVCGRRRDCPDESIVNGVQVHRAGFDSLKEYWYFLRRTAAGRGRVGERSLSKPGSGARFAAWLYHIGWKSWHFPDDAAVWYFPARRRIAQLLADTQFDAVISVSLPFTGHLLGLWVKRRFPKLPWLADIGDPFALQPAPPNNAWLYGALGRRLERRVLETADATAVTTAFTRDHYARHFGAAAVARMQVVPPLLHPVAEVPPATNSGDFPDFPEIGYAGALYHPVRTPWALLDLLDRTLARRPDWRGRLRVHWYGEIFPEYFKALMAHPAIVLHGLQPRAVVRAALQQLPVLLNIGNRSAVQLPSKAVEYLATGKPIVHLSYVDPDPFVEFFPSSAPVLTLKIKDDRVCESSLEAWLRLLENPPPPLPPAKLLEQIKPYSIERLAEEYEKGFISL